MSKDEEYVYQYPSNLEQEAQALFWNHKSLIVIIFGVLFAVFILINFGSLVPGIAVALYALFTAKLPDEDMYRISDYFTIVINFVFSPKIWQYFPGEFKDELLVIEDGAERISHTRKNAKKKEKHVNKPKKRVVSKEQIKRDKIKELERKRKHEMSTDENGNKIKKSPLAMFAPLIIVLVVGIICIFAFVVRPKITAQYANNNANITINYSDSTDIAWFSGTIDPLNYVVDTDGSTVTANPSEIDSTKLGSVTVTYTVTDSEGNTKDFTREYNVVDLDLPIITLKSNEITIQKGSSFDAKSNIDSVVDKVDGALSYADQTTFKAYTITSNVDTDTIGDYKVEISAIDSNGNESTASYSVSVTE